MAIKFSYSYEDIREAFAASSMKKKRKASSPLFGWLLFLSLAIVFFTILTSPSPIPPRWPTSRPASADLLLLLTPHLSVSLLLLGLLILAVVNSLLKRKLNANTERQQQLNRFLGMAFAALFVGIEIFNLYEFTPARHVIEWHPQPIDELFVAYLPWLVFFALAIACIYVLRKRKIQTLWVKSKSLRRPKEVEFDEEAFFVRDSAVELRVRWSTLARYRETANLVVVFNEDGQMHVFPKRAFAPSELLMRLRGVIHSNISEGEFLPQESAFPVSPPSPVLPVE